MTYAVKAEGLRKAFGGTPVLDGVDLTVGTGSIVALLGPNGAGKTTLIRILATLIRPDAGTATVAGHDLLADPVGVRRSISLTGQYAAVDDMLTGEENMRMMGRLLHLPRPAARARSADLLAEFGLADAAARRVKTYSGGMRRRLDLAIAMIARPPLLFLDEPSTGLDPRSREQLWGTVGGLADAGVTVLLTTQYLEEADQLADVIALLDHGRIVAQGTADELKSSLGGEVVRLEFGDQSCLRRAVACVAALRVDERLRTVEVGTDGSAASVHELLGRLRAAGAPAARVSVERPSLDDVFLSLTGPRQQQPAEPDKPAPTARPHRPAENASVR
ncbi:MAG: ATP-binding cassette domain-containing protein [Trebonia sp.]|jgi:ABC-2 type transport system ATP-binding protein